MIKAISPIIQPKRAIKWQNIIRIPNTLIDEDHILPSNSDIFNLMNLSLKRKTRARIIKVGNTKPQLAANR